MSSTGSETLMNEAGRTASKRATQTSISRLYCAFAEGWRDRCSHVHYVDYIEWHAMANLLDRLVTDWSHAVRGIIQSQLALIDKPTFLKQ